MIWVQRELEQELKNKYLQAKRKINREISMKRVQVKNQSTEMSLASRINWISLTLYPKKWSVMRSLWKISQVKRYRQLELHWKSFLKMNLFSKAFIWLIRILVQRTWMTVMAYLALNFQRGKMRILNKNQRNWGRKSKK